MSDKHYAKRNPFELEPYYTAHVCAMTDESLHEKHDIALELAYRDKIISEQNEKMSAIDGDISYFKGNASEYEAEAKASNAKLEAAETKIAKAFTLLDNLKSVMWEETVDEVKRVLNGGIAPVEVFQIEDGKAVHPELEPVPCFEITEEDVIATGYQGYDPMLTATTAMQRSISPMTGAAPRMHFCALNGFRECRTSFLIHPMWCICPSIEAEEGCICVHARNHWYGKDLWDDPTQTP